MCDTCEGSRSIEAMRPVCPLVGLVMAATAMTYGPEVARRRYEEWNPIVKAYHGVRCPTCVPACAWELDHYESLLMHSATHEFEHSMGYLLVGDIPLIEGPVHYNDLSIGTIMKSYNQEPEKFEGQDLDHVWWDEDE